MVGMGSMALPSLQDTLSLASFSFDKEGVIGFLISDFRPFIFF